MNKSDIKEMQLKILIIIIFFYRRPERLTTVMGGVDGRQWFFSANIDPSSSETKQVVYKFSLSKYTNFSPIDKCS